MKIDKETAGYIWCTYGKVIVGSILCVAGLITANKGARACGRMDLGYALYKASPEEFEVIANKLKNETEN